MTKPPSPTSHRMQARIIDAVVETVATRGLSGTTLANVAATAGVSQGVLVFHFKSKDRLLGETLRRLGEEYRQAWEPALKARDPLAQILGLIRADFSPEVCSPKKLALWFAFWGEAAAEQLYKQICEEAEDLRYKAMVGVCTKLGQSGAGPDPVLLAHSIDAMTDGLWLQMHIYGQRVGRRDALDKALGHLRLLLPALAQQI
ncbi:MAG: TetR family transcriptional regulator C-terminal domain-containing protein [Albidovulum sp.]